MEVKLEDPKPEELLLVKIKVRGAKPLPCPE
jgi:hypothetical protein